MAELTSIAAGITVDGAIFPKNVFVYGVSQVGVRVLNDDSKIFIEIPWEDSTIDGDPVESRADLLEWIEENAFGDVDGGTVEWGDVEGKPVSFPSAWEDVSGKPSTFAPAAHTHVIADVTGLQSELDGKQASGSYATSAQLTALTARVTALEEAGEV